MKTGTTAGLGILLLLALSASAPPQFGTRPEGRFSTMFGSLDWEPDCELYWPSYYTRQDADALRRGVNNWTDCVDRQAQADVQVAVRAIEQGKEEAVQAKLAELRRY